MSSQPVDDSSPEAKDVAEVIKQVRYYGQFPGRDDIVLSNRQACDDAADTLERQAAEIERLTQALKAIRLHVKITAGSAAPMSSVYQIAEQALAEHGVSVQGSDGEG